MGEISKLFHCKINENIMVSLMRLSLFPKYNLLPVLGHRHSPELCSEVMLHSDFLLHGCYLTRTTEHLSMHKHINRQ